MSLQPVHVEAIKKRQKINIGLTDWWLSWRHFSSVRNTVAEMYSLIFLFDKFFFYSDAVSWAVFFFAVERKWENGSWHKFQPNVVCLELRGGGV